MIDTVLRPLALLALPALALLVGGLYGSAAAGPAGIATPVTTAGGPTVTLHTDSVAAHPAGPRVAGHASAAAAPAPDASGQPPAPPQRTLPGPDACESQAIPHFAGFTQMSGSGTDTLTEPDGSTITQEVYRRHVAVQVVCLNGTGDGGVEEQVVIQPVGIDASTYDLILSPAGLTVVSITPGRPANGFAPVPVGQRIGPYPSAGCARLSAPGIDDSLCFSPQGSLRHLALSERGTSRTGARRDLQASFDLIPNG